MINRGIEHVKKNAKYDIATLKIGYAALGWLGLLYFVSFSWPKKKKLTGRAWTKVYAAIWIGSLGLMY